jgi:hypothetical protein
VAFKIRKKRQRGQAMGAYAGYTTWCRRCRAGGVLVEVDMFLEEEEVVPLCDECKQSNPDPHSTEDQGGSLSSGSDASQS